MSRIPTRAQVLAAYRGGTSGGSTGGGIALPTPDRTVGDDGSFGLVSAGIATIPGGSRYYTVDSWGDAYLLGDNASHTTAVDDDWMTWDPASDVTFFTVKRAGWYLLLFSAGVRDSSTHADAPDGPVYFSVGSAAFNPGLDFLGYELITPRTAIPLRFAQKAESKQTLVYLDADTQLSMDIDGTATTGDFDLEFAQITLVPLFDPDVSGTGDFIPLADPPAATIDTTTYTDPISGRKMHVVLLPADDGGTVLAVAREDDTHPRWLLTADGLYVGDGSVNPYSGGGFVGWDSTEGLRLGNQPTSDYLLIGEGDTNAGSVSRLTGALRLGAGDVGPGVIIGGGNEDPNGNQGGNVGDLYFRTDGDDTTAIYRCSTSGVAGTAVWDALATGSGGGADTINPRVTLYWPAGSTAQTASVVEGDGNGYSLTITTPPILCGAGDGFSIRIDVPTFSGTLGIGGALLIVTNLDGSEVKALGTNAYRSLSSGETDSPFLFDTSPTIWQTAGTDLVADDPTTPSELDTTAGGVFIATLSIDFQGT